MFCTNYIYTVVRGVRVRGGCSSECMLLFLCDFFSVPIPVNTRISVEVLFVVVVVVAFGALYKLI